MAPAKDIEEHLVYPGGYQPMEGRELPDSVAGWKRKKLQFPAIHVMDLPELVKVELVLPGFRREDFCVCCRSRTLQVYAMHFPANASEGLPEKFERQIQLPAEVAVEFISAEYQDGVLRFHLPKARESNPEGLVENHEIVIY